VGTDDKIGANYLSNSNRCISKDSEVKVVYQAENLAKKQDYGFCQNFLYLNYVGKT
jgi:hypothetical protein